MKFPMSCFIAALLIIFGAVAPAGAEALWKAGVATTNITPAEPLWMGGYGGRTKPAEGKATDLWVKVLALEDARGHRAVVMTSDVLGIPKSIYDNVSRRVQEVYALEPHQVLLTASHTHCGPALRNSLYDAYPLKDADREIIEKYSTALESMIVETIGRAIGDLAPAKLAAGQGRTGFAVNRRTNPEGQVPKRIAEGKLEGPVDHTVPVLAVSLPDGKLKAVLFGYACHNTVMSFNKWCGDYSGYAQIALQKSHPGATAMFFMGCGGDQNPLPRRLLSQAERYGNMLAAAVEETLLAPPRTVQPDLKTSIEMIDLKFGPAPSREDLEKLKVDGTTTQKRYAERLLAELNAGKTLARSHPYPVQAWRLGGEQLLITLGGEVVVDYALKFKKRYGPQTWVAAYCNDVMTYIPSSRVLKEGGYEGGGANFAYGVPAYRWADDVEETISGGVHRLVKQVQKR